MSGAEHRIDYQQIAARWTRETAAGTEGVVGRSIDDYHRFLSDELTDAWCEAYARMPNDGVELVEFADHGFRFVFDLVSERVVAAYGVSAPTQERRDAARMAGFLAGSTRPSDRGRGSARLAELGFRDRFFELRGDSYDRGHFISHKQGGGLDVNLFPQRSDINQGRSIVGRQYRAMERRCAARSGVFCFSRPIYRDQSWIPYELDYGLSEEVGHLEVRTFPN